MTPNKIIYLLKVAIPSNQVGNFHRTLLIAGLPASGSVAIPSNQVGNFHHGRAPSSLTGPRYVAIPSNQVGNFHLNKEEMNYNILLESRNPFKSGR